MGTFLVIPKLTKLHLVPKFAESTIWNGNDNIAKAPKDPAPVTPAQQLRPASSNSWAELTCPRN
jgi:hypothetical protein